MTTESRDREWGIQRKITRRDFLDGATMAVGAAALGAHLPAAGTQGNETPGNPPALTGLRGDQEKVFEVAHKLRDNKSWEVFGTPEEESDSYDLIVVGAGISGLAAAHFYRKHVGDKARILILDNHDDFGGMRGATSLKSAADCYWRMAEHNRLKVPLNTAKLPKAR